MEKKVAVGGNLGAGEVDAARGQVVLTGGFVAALQ